MLKYVLLTISMLAIASPSWAQLPAGPAAKKVSTGKKKGITITPSVAFMPDFLRKEVKPGETLTEKLVVQNGTKTDIEAELLVFDLYTDENTNVILNPNEKNKKGPKVKPLMHPSIKANISIPEKIFKLKANEKKIITYSIKVPENATGSYYYRYSVQPLSKYDQQIKKNLSGAVGFLMNINAIGVVMVKDKQDQKGEVAFKGDYNKAAKKLIVQSSLKNTGHGYLRNVSATAVIIKNNEVVAKLDLNQIGKNPALYPNTKKSYLGTIDVPMEKGEYKVVVTYQDEKKWLVQSSTHSLVVK